MATAQMQVVEQQSTVDSVPFAINLGFTPTSFHFWNNTQYNAATNQQILEGEWNQFLDNGELYVLARDTGAPSHDISKLMASGGVQPYDGSKGLTLGPVQIGTTCDKTLGKFNAALHGLNNGDVVLIYDNDNMVQLSGNFFGVSDASDPNFFIVMNPGFMDTARFTNDTAFKFRKVLTPVMFIPQVNLINMIDAANPMVVYPSVQLPLKVGMKVKIRVPADFEMVQANDVVGVITSVTDYKFGVDDPSFTIGSVDASAFTAFAWPAAASPFKSSFPQVVPFGSGPTGSPAQDLLDDQVRNQAFQGVVLGVGDGTLVMPAVGDVIQWRAIRADSNS